MYSSGKFTTFIALNEGKLVGMVSGFIKKQESIILKPKTVGFINELVVLTEYRRSNLATRLMKKIEDYFMENDAEGLCSRQ